MIGSGETEAKSVSEKKSKRKDSCSSKSPITKKTSSLIRRLKLGKGPSSPPPTVSATTAASAEETVLSSNVEPSTSATFSRVERQTPQGDENLTLAKSASDTNLADTAKDTPSNSPSRDKYALSAASLTTPRVIERTKSLENVQKMPAYGDLIFDASSSASVAVNNNADYYIKKNYLFSISLRTS